jgi:hypothetical protein
VAVTWLHEGEAREHIRFSGVFVWLWKGCFDLSNPSKATYSAPVLTANGDQVHIPREHGAQCIGEFEQVREGRPEQVKFSTLSTFLHCLYA